MGSSPRPGSCRGPQGVQVARSELSWNFRLLCAFLQGALLCPTCSGDGEPCFDVLLVFFFFLALGVFFLPTRLTVFCRLLLWAGASRGDVWASRPRASCCWLPLGQVSLGETEAREGIQATSPKSLGGNGRSTARARAPGTSPRTRGWARCCCPPWVPPTLWLCVLGDRASPWLLLCPSGCCCVRSRRLSTSGTWPPRLAGIPSPLTTTPCA